MGGHLVGFLLCAYGAGTFIHLIIPELRLESPELPEQKSIPGLITRIWNLFTTKKGDS